MGRPLVVLLGVLAAGCVSSQVSRLDLDPRPARPPEAIKVLEQAPEAPYTVIARVQTRTGAIYHDEKDLLRKLVEEAAALGGDALILGEGSTDSRPLFLVTGMIMTEDKTLPAEVIVFDRPEAGPGVGPHGGF